MRESLIKVKYDGIALIDESDLPMAFSHPAAAIKNYDERK